MYNLGQTVRVVTTVKDPAGALVTNATVTCAATAPDGTSSAPGVTNNGDGTYRVDIVGNQVGFWLYVFTATGTAQGVDQGQFTIRPTGIRILSLGEAKRQLNKLTTNTIDDEEIWDYVDMATILLETLVGVLTPRTIVEDHYDLCPWDVLRPRFKPLLSVTSIVEHYVDGTQTSLAGSDYLVDTAGRRVVRVSAGLPWPWGKDGTLQYATFTYKAGRSTINTNVRLAAAELVANLWRTTQTRTAPQRPGIQSAIDMIPVTYAIPKRVQEMLFGSRKAPLLGG